MGAKKNRDVAVLDHKAKKFKERAQKMRDLGISEKKIAKMEAKQEKYELWLEEVEQMGDY